MTVPDLPTRPSSGENASKEGLRIITFDGGGPGSFSQLLMLKEIIRRLEWDSRSQEGMDSDDELDFDEDELCPADYFDMMGGVGFGAYCALLLGRLRLPISRAIVELINVAHAMFPNTPNEILTPDANSDKLKGAIEDMLRRNGFPVNTALKGKTGTNRQCKVVVFIPATSIPGNCTPFRSYPSRSSSPKCTFVEAACATLSGSPDFSPVAIGLAGMEIRYAGVPFGFNNPTRKVLNEALMTFGEQKQVALILSLGAGKQSIPSIQLYASFDGNNVTLQTRLAMESERVDDELVQQLTGAKLYLRLDVDKGLEDTKTSDWHRLDMIGAHTQSYLENGSIATSIDRALRSLRAKENLTFAQLNGAASQAVSRVPIEQILNDVEREVKNMRDIVTQSAEKITLIDTIGNRTSIPLQYCVTYEMLQDMVNFYFKHQKVPGGSFVNRGDYKLVSGEDKRTIKAYEWTYCQVPNLTLEMSIVVRKQGNHSTQCPKCSMEFDGNGTNGWAVCSNQTCKMQYQYEESKNHGKAANDNPSSISQAETKESVDDFRLISVIYENVQELFTSPQDLGSIRPLSRFRPPPLFGRSPNQWSMFF